MAYERMRPTDCPQAAGYEPAFCKGPNCGLHIISLDKHGNAICETVMSAEQTLHLIEVCQKFLYEKATKHV